MASEAQDIGSCYILKQRISLLEEHALQTCTLIFHFTVSRQCYLPALHLKRYCQNRLDLQVKEYNEQKSQFLTSINII